MFFSETYSNDIHPFHLHLYILKIRTGQKDRNDNIFPFFFLAEVLTHN